VARAGGSVGLGWRSEGAARVGAVRLPTYLPTTCLREKRENEKRDNEFEIVDFGGELPTAMEDEDQDGEYGQHVKDFGRVMAFATKLRAIDLDPAAFVGPTAEHELVAHLPINLLYLRIYPPEMVSLGHLTHLHCLSIGGGEVFSALSYDTDATKLLYSLPRNPLLLHFHILNADNTFADPLLVAALLKALPSTRRSFLPQLKWLFLESATSDDSEPAMAALSSKCTGRGISLRPGGPVDWQYALELAEL
jgi:hypothetical protein